MQYLDGVFTVRRGNVINFAASNVPTGVDDALRNRFNDRLLIDGPVTAEDFADMVVVMAEDLAARGLLNMEDGYEPFATQDIPDEEGTWSAEDVSAFMAEELSRYGEATIIEFGEFVAELKEQNPRITGRSMRAIVEAVKERSANFDLPREWFVRREAFLDIPYDEKVSRLEELYTPISPDMLFQEAQRYFESEERFARTEAEGHVTRGYNNFVWSVQAELKFLEEQLAAGKLSDLTKLTALRELNRRIASEKSAIVERVLRRAEAAEPDSSA
jgi:hypothetical protein